MLQDLSHGKLEIEYRSPNAAPDALALCFRGGDILLRRNRDDSLMLPKISQVLSWTNEATAEKFRYLFRLQGVDCFLWMGDGIESPEEDFSYEPARALRQLTSKDLCYGIMTASAAIVLHQPCMTIRNVCSAAPAAAI